MEIQDNFATFISPPPSGAAGGSPRPAGASFRSRLLSEAVKQPPPGKETISSPRGEPSTERSEIPLSGRRVAGVYENTAPPAEGGIVAQMAKYKDDQLLSNPGGDSYSLDQARGPVESTGKTPFWERIGKDVSDALANAGNFFQDLLFGSKTHYRDESGEIRETKKRGVLGSVGDFFKDLGSALSFGAWRPDGEDEPEGFLGRVKFFFSKIKEAVFGDLIQGVTGGVMHMAEDLLFSAWNLAETVPDATIGNFEAGERLTSSVFDNGQVVLDYITDVLPGGEGYIRVHSPDLGELKPPFLNNIQTPEQGSEDERWKYVRNTPFRKAVETTGSILSDLLTLRFLGQLRFFGEERKNQDW